MLCSLLRAPGSHARVKETLIKISEPDYDTITEFGYDSIMLGQSLGPRQHMMPLVDRRPRLNPLLLSPPVAGCDIENDAPCFLRLGDDGVLAVYSGTGPADPHSRLLTVVVGPNPTPSDRTNSDDSVPIAPLLSLETDGNVVLRARDTPVPRILWASGTTLPPICVPESPCAKGAHVSLLPDGSLALFLGISAAARAYLEVGLPAVSKLEQCLWHNDFTGEGFDAPRKALEALKGGCYVPPIFSLISFPSSGATFTLEAIASATNHSVYTCSHAECAGVPAQAFRNICGKDSWNEFAMCPMPMAKATEKETPPGKAAVLKNHVIGNGENALCAHTLFQRGMLMGENGAPFEPYGFARLFRNPFDNIVGRMHHRVEGSKLKITYSKEGFLADEALYPQHDIWTYLYWHLNANLALRSMNKPTALYNLKNVDRDQAMYMREVLSLMGYTPEDVSTSLLQSLFPGPLSAELEAVERRLRFGDEDLPVHIDFYDAPTVHYLAAAIETVVEGSNCLTRPYCIQPPHGFREWDDLLGEGSHS